MAENGTLPPEPTYPCCVSVHSACPQNNEVQLSTSMGMSYLVLIRNCATGVTLVRFMIQAREVSFLDFVRNKDRRVVESIV